MSKQTDKSTSTGKALRVPRWLLSLVLVAGFSVCWSTALAQTGLTPKERAREAHELMHHGLAMVTEAADLVMISRLGMEPDLDQQSAAHGNEVLRQGRELIDSAVVAVTALADEVDDQMLTYSRRLGEAYLAYADLLSGMPAPDPDSDQMAVHHMHMLINHAVQMSAAGANLTMIGSRGSDVDVAELGSLHGRTMLDNAEITLQQVETGPAMQRAHQAGLTGTPGSAMETTHQMLFSARRIHDLMSDMPLQAN